MGSGTGGTVTCGFNEENGYADSKNLPLCLPSSRDDCSGGCFFLTLFLHLPFAIFDAFGEQDAARIAREVQYGATAGKMVLKNGRQFSVPMYAHLLSLSLRAGLISANQIIFTMALMSVLFSSLFSAVFFVFVHSISGTLFTAGITTLLVQVCPFFWLSSLYGFPTIVALGVFMVSVVVFQSALPRATLKRPAGIVVATLLFFAAVMCKTDMVTAAPLLCLPVWLSGRSFSSKAAWTLGILLTAIAAFLLMNQYGAWITHQENIKSSWSDWTNRFFGGLALLRKFRNVEIISRAAGAVSIPLAFLGALLALRIRSYRPIVWWTLLTVTPIAVFWSMMGGNSARHNLIPAVFVTILIGLPTAFLPKWWKRGWCLVIAVACVVNYFWWPPTSSTVKPSGRLLESAMEFKTEVRGRALKAREITRLPYDKILVVVPETLLPTYTFELLAADHLEFLKKGGGKYIVREKDTMAEKVFFFPGSDKRRKALRTAQKEGFHIVGDR